MTKGLAAGLLLTAGWGSDCGTRNWTDHWGPAEGPAPDPVWSVPVRSGGGGQGWPWLLLLLLLASSCLLGNGELTYLRGLCCKLISEQLLLMEVYSVSLWLEQ